MSRDKDSNYYDAGGVEVLDVIRAKLTPEQYEGYLLGNAIKYALRLNFKGVKNRDSVKLANYSTWYQDFLIESQQVKEMRMPQKNNEGE